MKRLSVGFAGDQWPGKYPLLTDRRYRAYRSSRIQPASSSGFKGDKGFEPPVTQPHRNTTPVMCVSQAIAARFVDYRSKAKINRV